nr:hypothetical protein [uncultured Draconibacterium sp.]
MAETVITDLRVIDIKKVKPSGFVDTHIVQKLKTELQEMKVIVDMLLNIKDKTELPARIRTKIRSFNTSIVQFVREVEEDLSGTFNDIKTQKQHLAKQITKYYNQCFNSNQNNYLYLLETLAIANSFVKPELQNSKEIERLQKDYEAKLGELSATLITIKESKLQLNKNKQQSETILKELQKKVSEQTVSDYAVVFGTQAGEHKTLADKWLKTGIWISAIFIALIIICALTNFLPTERIGESGNILGYNISNIITKALIIALIIFVISFSFKQYSVNRHLQALNTQRQKALNSYKLFMASISKDDINSRNALMIQVAKAIYEPQSTGFLSEKGQQVNSGLVEITKLISQNGA